MYRMLMLIQVALSMAACSSDAGTQPSPPPPTAPLVVVDATGALAAGLDIFVDTDRGQNAWLTTISDGLQAAYPSGQQWGFIGARLLGPTALGSRPGRDLSAYRTLQLDLRGASGGESVEIGIKDNTDPDSGTETKKTVALSSAWQTFTYPLNDFTTADLTRVYLLFEVVFNGATGRTVYVRNVRYVP
jgi:hypothetical protein